MKRMTVAFAVLLGTGVPLSAQTAATPELEGAWRFTFSEGKVPVAVADGVISVDERQISVMNAAGQGSVRADAKNGSFTVPMSAVSVDGHAEVDAVVTIKPGNDAKSWTGSAIIKNKKYDVAGTPLPSLWACSHSNPIHTASSSEEMKEKAAEHGCSGWHRVK